MDLISVLNLRMVNMSPKCVTMVPQQVVVLIHKWPAAQNLLLVNMCLRFAPKAHHQVWDLIPVSQRYKARCLVQVDICTSTSSHQYGTKPSTTDLASDGLLGTAKSPGHSGQLADSHEQRRGA